MKTTIYTTLAILTCVSPGDLSAAEPSPSSASQKKAATKSLPKDQILFKAYDHDQDEQLSEREFKKAPLIREADRDLIEDTFKAMDKDQNNTLSLKEYLIGQPALKLLFRASSAVMDDGQSADSAKEIKRILRTARS